MGLDLLVSGGTDLSVPVNALIEQVDESVGERARDFREEVVLKGIELATAASLDLPVNVTPGGALIWHKGRLHAVSAGTTVAGLPDDSVLYVYYDADRSGNPFYASAVATPAGTADVRVGIAVTSGGAITSTHVLLHGDRNWRRCYNASGGQLNPGDVVVFSASGDWHVTTTASAGNQDVAGVAAEVIAAASWGIVDFSGPALVRCTGAVARGDLLETSATATAAQANNAPTTMAAAFARAAGARSGAGTSLVPAVLGSGSGAGGGASVSDNTPLSDTLPAVPGTGAGAARTDHRHPEGAIISVDGVSAGSSNVDLVAGSSFYVSPDPTGKKILLEGFTIDGVARQGGNIDIVAGSNIYLSPDNVGKRIFLDAGSLDGVASGGGNIDIVAGSNVYLVPDNVGKRVFLDGWSLDGVSRQGGNIDLVAGTNVTITPDDDAKTITIAASGAPGGNHADTHAEGASDALDSYDLRAASLTTPAITGGSTNLVIRPEGPAIIGAVVRGYAGQSAAQFEVQNSAAAALVSVSAGGILYVSGGVLICNKLNASNAVTIGFGQTSDQNAYLDLTSDTTYTPGLRLIRNAGANAGSTMQHRGTGALVFICTEAAAIQFSTTNVARVTILAGGYVGIGAVAPATILHMAETVALTGALADGYSAGQTYAPGYTGAQTVTRHNYMDCRNPSLAGGAALTDACLVRFNAAAGTHKAVDAGSDKDFGGELAAPVAAWIKFNLDGTVLYSPLFTSKT